jgi:hypothetical protein
MDSSPHAAKMAVGVMLRAANTAVQALIADISPWILSSGVSMCKRICRRVLRRITSTEICTSAYDRVTGVIYDDGAVSCKRTWSALLEESFVGLLQSDTTLERREMGKGTSRMYFTRVLYGMPLTTTPDMS